MRSGAAEVRMGPSGDGGNRVICQELDPQEVAGESILDKRGVLPPFGGGSVWDPFENLTQPILDYP